MDSPLTDLIPNPRLREFHQRRVEQPPDVVWQALASLSPQDMTAIRVLMSVRALPAAFGRRPLAEPATMLDTMRERGWFDLASDPGRLVVIGSIGQFWRLRPGQWRRDCPPAEFRAYAEPGFAKSATAFELIADGDATILRTETRVTADDQRALRRMSAYWALIRPVSGLIRRLMLRAIAGRADRLAPANRRLEPGPAVP
ncbi:hypothetical protein [Actinophytocola sediminis]